MKFIKNSIKIITPFFTVLMLDISIALYIVGDLIHPLQVVKLFIMSFVLGMLTALRKELDSKKWMLKLSYSLKRIIFLPLYLIITLITLLNLGAPFKFKLQGVCFTSIVFLIAFIVSCFITYSLERKRKEEYSQALDKYKKKIEDEKI